jgi:hypothetical protein
MNTALNAVWALVPLAQEMPDPEDVKPGWLGFGIFLLLAAAVVFLAFSFRKQLKRVNFPTGEDEKGAADDAEDRPESPGGDRRPRGTEEGPDRSG